jgi:hypothetical protein
MIKNTLGNSPLQNEDRIVIERKNVPSEVSLKKLSDYVANAIDAITPTYICIRDDQGSTATTIGGSNLARVELVGVRLVGSSGSISSSSNGIITNTGTSGYFSVSFTLSIEPDVMNEQYGFVIYKNGTTPQNQSNQYIETSNNVDSLSSTSIIQIGSNETIALYVEGQPSIFTTRSLNISVVKL